MKVKTDDGLTTSDEISNDEAKQQKCLRESDEETVAIGTAFTETGLSPSPSVDAGMINNNHVDVNDDENEEEDNEIEDGELVSSSASESEVEPQETVSQKGKTYSILSSVMFSKLLP